MQIFPHIGWLLLWSIVGFVMAAIAVWLIRRVRHDVLSRSDSAIETEQMLRQFEALKAEGKLEDREYRAIRERLRNAKTSEAVQSGKTSGRRPRS